MGFEWLTAESLEGAVGEVEAEEGEEAEVKANKLPPAKVLYLTMPSAEAMRKLLSQWAEFKRKQGAQAPWGLAPLWNMFSLLRDLRGWSAQDRVDPSIAKYVDLMLAGDPDREVVIEFSLWYREETKRRGEALASLNEMLKLTGGTLLDVVEIPEIRYQGALARVPAGVAKDLKSHVGTLAQLEDVMTIRPQSIFSVRVSDANSPALRELTAPGSDESARCIAALLDGFPVAAHAALAGRLHVHEVDISGAQAPVNLRNHGTAMASLILHGDLHRSEASLDRKVAVIPVLTGDAASGIESTPRDKLPIGIIYRALKAIVAANPTTASHLADIAIVNHSIGDTMAPFVRRPSPWAALLDYFSHHHRLLFIISAGNIESAIPTQYESLDEFHAADPAEREAAIMLALWNAKGQRGLLSPAESVNGLTVGALHADGSDGSFGAAIDPYPKVPMPNLASAVGFGTNRSIKPDLLHEGGRFAAAAASMSGGGVSISPRAVVDVGQLVAAPSVTGDLRHVTMLSGTSNAAALTTRAGLRIANSLDESFASDIPANHWLQRPTRAVLLKALIAHGSAWGTIGRILERTHKELHHHGRRDTISKLIGYGALRIEQVLSGDENRITLIADDVIRHDQLHEYLLPIPRSMLQSKDLRSITMTLAWTTPILPASIDYRSVALKIVDRQGNSKFWEGVERKFDCQPNGSTSERGTLLHMTLGGDWVQRESLAGGIFIGVQAFAKHASVKKVLVPYALAITMEVASAARATGLYTEVAQGIRQPQVRDGVRVGQRT